MVDILIFTNYSKFDINLSVPQSIQRKETSFLSINLLSLHLHMYDYKIQSII